jgi:penicillin amidase
MGFTSIGSLTLSATIVGICAACLGGCSEDPPSNPPDKVVGPVFGPLGDRADLPADERIVIEHLAAPVDVVRDEHGRPHIYASSIEDAMRVEGYLVARDRALQLELLRRSSEGRMAEILAASSPTFIAQDIVIRHAGLARVAGAEYEAMTDGEPRRVLDAYADGVTQVFKKIRAGEIKLPAGITGVSSEIFTDWTGVDSLAIARYQTYLLSYDINLDIYFQQVLDGARKAFSAGDPDPQLARRAGIERDLWRFAPADPAATTTGYPTTSSKLERPKSRGARGLDPKALPARKPRPGEGVAERRAPLDPGVKGYLDALAGVRDRIAPDGFGSNGWVVHPSRSATGHAMLASDPHLALGAPAVFWPVSIDVTPTRGDNASAGLKAAGVAFPGIPGITLGHNEHVAWGATVAGYDVTDAYAETLTPDGKSVMFKGNAVALQTVDEVIQIQGQAPYTYHVKIVPHHGPILPTLQNNMVLEPAGSALSIRWTGFEPTEEFAASLGLLRAGSVDEARGALEKFSVGAQNWMLADTAGDILWTSHARVPVRDPQAFAWNPATYQGNLPCLVLPGDGSAEWKGFLPSALVPWAKNPASGYLATANNDPIGDSVDNDPSNGKLPDGTPMYLHCSFDIGFREGRIQKRLDEHKEPLSTEDLAAIQADVRSPVGAALVPGILLALDRAEQERATPGSRPDLSAVVADPAYTAARVTAARKALDTWSKEADFTAASGIDPDTNTPLPDQGSGPEAVEARASEATLLFNVWFVRMLWRTLGDEYTRMGFSSFSRMAQAKALLNLFSADPTTLATYDVLTKDSAIWDDLDTPAVESRDERVIRALLDAFAWFDINAAGDLTKARWGAFHVVNFSAVIPLFTELSIPPGGDPLFSKGFPRPGDEFALDAAEFPLSYKPAEAPRFGYAGGPAQRLVIDLDPTGPKAWNALPGGAVWDAKSPHFRDEAELWRKNKTHPVPFLLSDVIAAKESRTVAAAP